MSEGFGDRGSTSTSPSSHLGKLTVTRARPERTGLDRFVGMDLRNFRTSRRLLRDNHLYDLPQRVTGVYTATRESVQHATTQRKTDDDVFFAVLFLLRSAYAFEKGIVEVMRLHLGDSYGYLRSAIEAAGFADLGSTTSATRTRAICCVPAFTRRWSASASVIRESRSRWMSTATSCLGCRKRRRAGWTPSSPLDKITTRLPPKR